MLHHFPRAYEVYRSRGVSEFTKTLFTYAPIELNNILFRLQHGAPTHMADEDWDTLIILDGCRYDMFSDQIGLEGSLESRISAGSTSEEFLAQNFEEGVFHDTVYVNTNAYLPKLGFYEDQTFHDVIDLLDEWDDTIDVVHPKTVVEAAQTAHDVYPNKRIIVHFMQPHYPFIGEFGQQIQSQIDDRSVWRPLRDDPTVLSLSDVWKGYRENLDIVLEHVSELLDSIEGKIVISADHGNMVGERQSPVPTPKLYGHYWGVYSPQLVKVPWFIVESGERRTIKSEPPREETQQSDALVEDRLEALGYK